MDPRAAPSIPARDAAVLLDLAGTAAATVAGGVLRHVNPAWSALLGWPPGTAVGDRLEELVDAERGRPPGRTGLRTAAGAVVPVDLRFGVAGGTTYVVATDLRAEDALRASANRDALTGLPNRAQLIDRLGHALRRRPGAGRVVVVFVDVDGLKAVNDLHGHEAGDAMLVAAAEALQAIARPADTVARLGGDEFVVLLEDAVATDLDRIGERVVRAVAGVQPATGGRVTASAGVVAVEPGDPALRPEALLADADEAMYRAKAQGGDRWLVYGAEQREATTARLRIARELRDALRDGGLELAFQPIVDVTERRRLGFEALVRWPQPGGEERPPEGFIPLAERDGSIVELGRWVLDRACAQAAAWRRQGVLGTMSVNVAPRQLAQPSFAEEVATTLRRHGLPGPALCIEITESSLLDDAGPAAAALERLRPLGVHVALDDFGKGFSSLSHLKAFPVDVVKIDRSFVDDVDGDGDDRALVRAVAELGKVLGMAVVAEGVETERQAAALLRLGCDVHQGFRYGRPAAAAELDLRGRPAGARREVGDPYVIREFMRQVGLPARVAR